MAIAIALHLLAAIYWIGGMLVMLQAVRPAAVALLEPAQRLALLCATLSRFFVGVWLSLAVLLATGLWMLFSVFGGFAEAGWHIHSMLLLYLVMATLFVYLYWGAYAALKQALFQQQIPAAAAQMARIALIVRINASLGVLAVIVGSAGRYLIF